MDYMVRAAAAEDHIRAFAATTRQMAETARLAHHTSPVCTAALGRTLTGAVMMGSMLKEEKALLTIQIKGNGPAEGITVTADSHGHAKGYVVNPLADLPLNARGKLDVAGAIGQGRLTVIRDIGLKEPYIGTINLVSGEIAEDLTWYFAESEQVPSSVGLGVLVDRDLSVKQSGGFLIQLMPDTPEEVIAELEERLKHMAPVTTMLEEGKSPEEILDSLIGPFSPKILEKNEVSFYCGCSKDRVEKALISVGADSIREMLEDGEPIDVSCSFCGKSYRFELDDLKRILTYQESRGNLTE